MVTQAILDRPALGIAFNGLLLVTAAWLWLRFRPGILIFAATIAGALSCLLWAAAFADAQWWLEPIYLALSSAWWLGLSRALILAGRRRYGILTAALGVAALLDVAVSLTGITGPAYALIGGWKLPLQLVWTVVTAYVAFRESRAPGQVESHAR